MNDTQMIEQRRTAFVNAFNRADVDAIAEFLTADLVSMPPNQPPLIGKEASRAWFKEGFTVGRQNPICHIEDFGIGDLMIDCGMKIVGCQKYLLIYHLANNSRQSSI